MGPSVQQLLIVLAIVILIFGAKKSPSLQRVWVQESKILKKLLKKTRTKQIPLHNQHSRRCCRLKIQTTHQT